MSTHNGSPPHIDISSVSSKDLLAPAIDPALYDSGENTIRSNEVINKSGYVRPKINPALLLQEMQQSMSPNQSAYEPFTKLLTDDGDGLSDDDDDDGNNPTEDELALLQSFDLTVQSQREEGEKALLEHMAKQPPTKTANQAPQKQYPTDRWRRVLPDGHIIKKVLERGYNDYHGEHRVQLAHEITGKQYERVLQPPRSIGVAAEPILPLPNNSSPEEQIKDNSHLISDNAVGEEHTTVIKQTIQVGRPQALSRAYGLLSVRVYDLARFVDDQHDDGEDEKQPNDHGNHDVGRVSSDTEDDGHSDDSQAFSSLMNQAIDAAANPSKSSLSSLGDEVYPQNTRDTNPLYGEELPYLLFTSMHEEVSILLGHAQSFRGLEVAISTMDVGERALILCSSKYGGKMEHIGNVISPLPKPQSTPLASPYHAYTFSRKCESLKQASQPRIDNNNLFFELTKPRGIIHNLTYQHAWNGLQAHRKAMMAAINALPPDAALPCPQYKYSQLPFAGYAHSMAAIPMDIMVVDPMAPGGGGTPLQLEHNPQHPLLAIPNEEMSFYHLTCFNNYHQSPPSQVDPPKPGSARTTAVLGSSNPFFHQLTSLPKHYILEFDFTLTRFEKESNLHMMERHDKLSFVEQRRQLSRSLINRWGKYQSAASQLHRGLSLLEDDAASEQQLTSSLQDYQISQKNRVVPKLGTHERRQLQRVVGTNLAICCNLLERWNDTLLLANMVLIKLEDVGNSKAIYARAKAHRGKGDYDQAMADFHRCESLLASQLEAIQHDGTTHEDRKAIKAMLNRVRGDIKQLRNSVIKAEAKSKQRMKGFLLHSDDHTLYGDKPDHDPKRDDRDALSSISHQRQKRSPCAGYWYGLAIVSHLVTQNISRMYNDCLDRYWRPKKRYKGN